MSTASNAPARKGSGPSAGICTTGTLFTQTTATGPGVVDFRCSDQDPASTVKYRFLQLTAIRVGTLASTRLP